VDRHGYVGLNQSTWLFRGDPLQRASKEGIGSIDARPVAPPTWQHHEEEQKLPEVIVTIAQSDRDLSYRVSDQGGGIAAAHVPQVCPAVYMPEGRQD